MPNSAVFTQADREAAQTAETPKDDNPELDNLEEEVQHEMAEPEKVDEVLEQAIARGFDPDYEGDDAKTAAEFIEYGEVLDEKKSQDRKERQLRDRLDRMEVERSILAESDSVNLRQKMLDLTSLHKEAVEQANYDDVQMLQKQMEQTKFQLRRVNEIAGSPQSKNTASIDEDAQVLIDKFESKNTWIKNGDDADTQYAQFLFNKSLGQSQKENQSDRVEEAIEAVKAGIPHRFKQTNNARKQAADSSKGKGRQPKASQITEKDLSREELTAYKSFKRAGIYKTPGEYHKEMLGGVEERKAAFSKGEV